MSITPSKQTSISSHHPDSQLFWGKNLDQIQEINKNWQNFIIFSKIKTKL